MIDEDPSKIIIGMIRSVKPTMGSQLRVGIEIISQHPTWVQLRQAHSVEAFPNTEIDINPLTGINVKNTAATIDIGLFSGIYLPIEAGLSELSMLILPKMNYRANTNYVIKIDGSPKRVLLGEPIESRDDWVKVVCPF